jgi:hypothetical protein
LGTQQKIGTTKVTNLFDQPSRSRTKSRTYPSPSTLKTFQTILLVRTRYQQHHHQRPRGNRSGTPFGSSLRWSVPKTRHGYSCSKRRLLFLRDFPNDVRRLDVPDGLYHLRSIIRSENFIMITFRSPPHETSKTTSCKIRNTGGRIGVHWLEHDVISQVK